MSRHKDDGTFGMGAIAVLACILSFGAGYWVRDSGFTMQLNQPKEAPQNEHQN
jgi:hypothetical protein